MLQIINRLRRTRRLLRARNASGSREWARLLDEHGIDVRIWPCEPREGGLFFSSLGSIIPGPARNVLLAGFRRAVNLHARGVVFDTTGDSVLAKVGSYSVRVETTEELQILEEIFLDGIYNFELSGPLLIVDIGMNTGYTALYFAAVHPHAVVCAFEPFAPTF